MVRCRLSVWVGLLFGMCLLGAGPVCVAQGAAPAKTAQGKAANSGAKIDVNSATAEQLKTIPGIGDAYAQRIIKGRPYANKTQLVGRGVLPQATYDKIKDQVVASRAASK